MRCGARALSLFALTFGLVAAGALSLAVATDFWLYIVEPIIPPPDNETETASASGAGASSEPFSVDTHSGLWRVCIIYASGLGLDAINEGFPPEACSSIDFNQGSERIDGADTTNSILRAIRKTAPLFIASLLLLLTALFLSILGTTKNDFRTIISAVIYIFSALSLAMGVIMYISAVNDEVAHRKKTDNNSSNSFYYRYGWAFFFGGATFICSMVAAVSNISLYLLRYSNLEDKALVSAASSQSQPMHDSKGYLPVRVANKSSSSSVNNQSQTEIAV